MKNILNIILLMIFLTVQFYGQSTPPKREMRAAWVATVTNLDWPSSPSASTEQKKQEAINLLNTLKASGVNAVFFQIRTECDALYQSNFEPWSYWLTGAQGTPPNPFFDPLQFWIEEAHKRGMELHAWFNPYRAERSVGSYTLSPQHVYNQNRSWVLTVGTFRFLNPGLPQVRNYISNIVHDVVSRYDVDGVHFDDYFYPYPPQNMTSSPAINALDDSAFAADPRGFTNKEDWRRDNINLMVAQVNNRIKTTKPWVKFGISPFGIWRPGYPAGITGMDAYATIYADALAWLRAKSIDYLTPQLYWPFGGSQDYGKLQPWWADSVSVYGLHYYPGQAFYRVSAWSNPSELPRQIRLNRSNPKVHGSVFFRAWNFIENPKGVTDSLKNDLFRFKALLPVMAFKDTVKPNPPRNLRYEKINGVFGLRWDVPLTASDGDTAKRYVVYKFPNSNIQPADLENPERIDDIVGSRQHIPSTSGQTGPFYFVVTALDRNYNESAMSNIVAVTAPSSPSLIQPVNGATNQRDTVVLRWNLPAGASTYRVQISTNSAFSTPLVLDQSNVQDTFLVVTGLEGQTQYFWRVNSSNAAGSSAYSSAFSFTTGFPRSPALVYPENNTGNIPIDTIVYWNRSQSAQTYRLMLARDANFIPSSIVLDVSGISDTTYQVTGLLQNTFYFWRVKASNQFGTSNWSTAFRFKTVSPVNVEDEQYSPNSFYLEQNYPNPFNPSTTIKFQIPQATYVTFKVYDSLGSEIKTLIDNEYRPAGIYQVDFDAQNLSSGMYFYKLITPDFVATKKMILIR